MLLSGMRHLIEKQNSENLHLQSEVTKLNKSNDTLIKTIVELSCKIEIMEKQLRSR